MELTNKLNLPEPFVNAVYQSEENYKSSYPEDMRSDISVTQLLNPPQQIQLMRDHKDELTEDVADRIWALLGQNMHSVLEAHGKHSTDFIEHRMFAEIEGWILSGQLDRYSPETETLQDYKLCSVWEKIYGLRPDRERQLNCLAWLLRGFHSSAMPVSKLEIVSVYRDWSKGQAGKNNYPPNQVEVHEVPLWTEEEQESYIKERIALHKKARAGEFVACTEEEQWAKETKWAVMKTGRKTAVKLHLIEEDAYNHAENEKGGYVEVRLGEKTRCKAYCAVGAAGFCPQKVEEERNAHDQNSH